MKTARWCADSRRFIYLVIEKQLTLSIRWKRRVVEKSVSKRWKCCLHETLFWRMIVVSKMRSSITFLERTIFVMPRCFDLWHLAGCNESRPLGTMTLIPKNAPRGEVGEIKAASKRTHKKTNILKIWKILNSIQRYAQNNNSNMWL